MPYSVREHRRQLTSDDDRRSTDQIRALTTILAAYAAAI